MLVEVHHSYDDDGHFNSYGGRLELRLSWYVAIQTRHNFHTIQAVRRNGPYV